jgi:8-hydroxy-5-deazaflavin:NADPH oxidoreductase
MKIAIIGAGHIGANCARRFIAGGHHVVLSFSRHPDALSRLRDDIGAGASVAEPLGAVASAEMVVLSVPWSAVDDALRATGDLGDRIVVDTTNQFGGAVDLGGRTAARFNQLRMPGARYTKSFNTLTAAFQARVAGRPVADRVVQWVAGDDAGAKDVVIGLLGDAGYAGVDAGGIDGCGFMEAPRRPGSVYGEEYRLPAALEALAAVAAGDPLPPTPHY